MNSTAPVLRLTRLAPGAAPCIFVPSERVTSRPATVPLTCIPWPPAAVVSVSSGPTSCTVHTVSRSGSQRTFMFFTTAEEPSSSARNGWDGSTPESMTATETPLPSSDVPSAPVRVLRASSPRVALLEVAMEKSMGWLPST